MKFDPQKHHRRSIRLKNYDYAFEGSYYVTVVTQRRECLFGEIVDAKMYLSNYGEIVQKWWDNIPNHFPNVETGAFVIMPNHIHGIVFVTEERRGEVVSPHDQPNDNNQKNTSNVNTSHRREESMQTSEPDNQGGEIPPLRRPTLGQIVAYFKYQSTKEMNEADNIGIITKFWQRNYYEHIIRNEKELKQKTDYILDNPSRWDEDKESPQNIKSPSS
jgi:putative transposase